MYYLLIRCPNFNKTGVFIFKFHLLALTGLFFEIVNNFLLEIYICHHTCGDVIVHVYPTVMFDREIGKIYSSTKTDLSFRALVSIGLQLEVVTVVRDHHS